MKSKSQKKISLRKLAEAVGRHHATVSKFVRLFPDAPRDDADAFAKFYKVNAITEQKDPKAEGMGARFTAAKVRKIEADAEAAEERLKGFKEAYLKREEIEADVERLAGEVQRVLRFRLCRELPPQLPGLTSPEIKDKIERLLDAIWNDHRNAVNSLLDQRQAEVKAGTSKQIASKSKARASRPKKPITAKGRK